MLCRRLGVELIQCFYMSIWAVLLNRDSIVTRRSLVVAIDECSQRSTAFRIVKVCVSRRMSVSRAMCVSFESQRAVKDPDRLWRLLRNAIHEVDDGLVTPQEYRTTDRYPRHPRREAGKERADALVPRNLRKHLRHRHAAL